MGVEEVRKDDTARTFEFLFRFNRVWINSKLLLLLLVRKSVVSGRGIEPATGRSPGQSIKDVP